MGARKRVVIVGSGFGGLNAALGLARAPVDITVVDRDNYHGFWPLLYQVATAGLGADHIAHPVRAVYRRWTNISVRVGTVAGVDLDRRRVLLERGAPLPYDYLVLAAGSATSDFGVPRLDLTRARLVLVEMTDHLLPGYSCRSQRAAHDTLRRKGVEVRLGTRLSGVAERGVTLADGTEVPARTVIWTAGVQASPLAARVPGAKGRGGTLVVRDDLSLPGHPEVFVVGDLACRAGPGGHPLPQVAPVAIQGGRHAARNIRRDLDGLGPKPSRYHDHGAMATIGRRAAVAELPGGVELTGTLGWLAWLAVHLVFLVGFRNRAVVLVNWTWNYLTWDRASRVILDPGPAAPAGPPRA